MIARRSYGARSIVEHPFVSGTEDIMCRVNHDKLAQVLASKQLTPLEAASCGARHFQRILDMERRAVARRKSNQSKYSEV